MEIIIILEQINFDHVGDKLISSPQGWTAEGEKLQSKCDTFRATVLPKTFWKEDTVT